MKFDPEFMLKVTKFTRKRFEFVNLCISCENFNWMIHNNYSLAQN